MILNVGRRAAGQSLSKPMPRRQEMQSMFGEYIVMLKIKIQGCKVKKKEEKYLQWKIRRERLMRTEVWTILIYKHKNVVGFPFLCTI